MNELVVRQPTLALQTMDEVERAAKAMSASGFFQDTKQAAQAVVKILAGQELGFGPFASMTGVNIIQNKPTLAANLLAAAVKRNGKYNYRVTEQSDQKCVITWFEGGKEVGQSSFTIEEAKSAGLTGKDNWKKYPSDMLFARAISRGQRRFAPDIFNGATVYTPEEMGADVDAEGNVITVTPSQEQPKPETKPETSKTTVERPLSAETLRSLVAKKAERYDKEKVTVSQFDRQIVAAVLDNTLGDKTKRYELCHYLVGNSSTKDMTQAQVKALMDWTECHTYDAVPPEYVKQEANSAHSAALIASGQLQMAGV